MCWDVCFWCFSSRAMLTAVVAACLALRPPPALPAAALGGAGRRAVLNTVGAALVGGLLPGAVVQPAAAVEALTLEDLPPKALSAYNQYWPALQLAADSYVFDVYDLLDNPGRWDSIAALTESSDIGSAASVSSLEREYLTPMRILTLSFPPDAGGDEMQEALDKFQASAFRLSAQARRGQTTGNVAQPSVEEVAAVLKSWDDGRMSINAFFDALNTGTSTTRLVGIPPKGSGYPRSKKLYVQLRKDAALCRNRGGEALAGLWGQLMVYGTVPGVNPCGNVNLQNYFGQQ